MLCLLKSNVKMIFSIMAKYLGVANRANDFCKGLGLEVGAVSNPFRFSNAKVLYADIISGNEMKQLLDSIQMKGLYKGKIVEPHIILNKPRFDLPEVSDNTFDFVYSSHSLEHSLNPINSLSEYFRIIKPGGVVYTVIPNKQYTYDIERPSTSVDTLIHKYNNKIFHYTLKEALDLAKNTKDHPLYTSIDEDFVLQIQSDGLGIHHFHVFEPSTTLDLIYYCALQFKCELLYFCVEGINIHFCLRKT